MVRKVRKKKAAKKEVTKKKAGGRKKAGIGKKVKKPVKQVKARKAKRTAVKKSVKKAKKTAGKKQKAKVAKKIKKKPRQKQKRSTKQRRKVAKVTKKKVPKKQEKRKRKEKKPEEMEITITKLQPPEEGGAREKKIVMDLGEVESKGEEVENKGAGTVTVQVKKVVEEEAEVKKKPKMRCPACGSTNIKLNYETGELVCQDCGEVITENPIDLGPEWRAFDAYQKTKRQRTGSPTKYTRPNKGLVTEIDKYNKDIRGSKLSPEVASQMGRIRKWQKRSNIASSIERNLAIALGDLERISSYLGLPQNVREAAAMLYRKAVEKGLIRGRLIESVVAAVIYTICRQYWIPRTLDEIAEMSGQSKKEIGRTYRFLKKELHIPVPMTDPRHYVSRFSSALGLSGRVQEKAKEILNEAIERGLISGRGPTGVAAAAVYIASVMLGERRTQKEVAEVAGVTEVTIRNRYRELKRELNIDIEDEEE